MVLHWWHDEMAGLLSFSLICAVYTLDTPLFMGGRRLGRILGAINHR